MTHGNYFGRRIYMVNLKVDVYVRIKLVGEHQAFGISNCLSSFVARPQVYHEVDVHQFADWPCALNRRFDRIVFNLPHAGTLFPQTQEAHPAQLEEHRFALLCWPICRNLGLGVDMLYGFSKKSSSKSFQIIFRNIAFFQK